MKRKKGNKKGKRKGKKKSKKKPKKLKSKVRKLKKKRTKKSKKKSKKIKISKTAAPEELIFKVPSKWADRAYVNKNQYEKKYKLSIKDNDNFWRKEGKRITWIKPYSKIKDVKYSKSDVRIKWFYDGTLNASTNCIDRHLSKNKNKTAIIWAGDDPNDSKQITYKQLHAHVCKAANGLKEIGVKRR